MTKEALIKILEGYEVFVDDDYGGSYKSVIAYAPDKKVSRAHTPFGTLKIIDTFEEIQKENQDLKKQLEDMTLCRDIASGHRKEVQDREIILLNQQKKFIEYLENEIKYWEEQEQQWIKLGFMKFGGEANNKIIFKKVLSKYKKIIGVKDE